NSRFAYFGAKFNDNPRDASGREKVTCDLIRGTGRRRILLNRARSDDSGPKPVRAQRAQSARGGCPRAFVADPARTPPSGGSSGSTGDRTRRVKRIPIAGRPPRSFRR